MPNFVSVAASVAELAHGEKLYILSITDSDSLSHPAYLIPREPKLALWKIAKNIFAEYLPPSCNNLYILDSTSSCGCFDLMDSNLTATSSVDEMSVPAHDNNHNYTIHMHSRQT